MIFTKKNFAFVILFFFILCATSFAQPDAPQEVNKPGTFKINMKIPGYFYSGSPRVVIGTDFMESRWILKKKSGDISLQLIIRVEVDGPESFFVLVAVDNASGINKYRGIFHHYKHDYVDNIWIYKKVKASQNNSPGIFLQIKSFINTKDIPLYSDKLRTLTYSKNPGTENIVGGFKSNVKPAAVKKWLLRAVKFTETAMTKNRN